MFVQVLVQVLVQGPRHEELWSRTLGRRSLGCGCECPAGVVVESMIGGSWNRAPGRRNFGGKLWSIVGEALKSGPRQDELSVSLLSEIGFPLELVLSWKESCCQRWSCVYIKLWLPAIQWAIKIPLNFYILDNIDLLTTINKLCSNICLAWIQIHRPFSPFVLYFYK